MSAVLMDYAEVLDLIDNSDTLSKWKKSHLRSFIEDRIEITEKQYAKNRKRKREQTRIKNESAMQEILKALQSSPDGKCTVSELVYEMPKRMKSHPLITAVLHRYLIPDGLVKREIWHGKVIVFSLVEEAQSEDMDINN